MPRCAAICFVAVAVSAGTGAQASPNISTVLRKDPISEQTSADELTWLLTFTEPVMQVDPPDFVVSGTTATLGLAALALDGEGCSVQWDATLSGGDLAGLNATVTLDPGKFDEDLHDECVTGSSTPCIWGCTGDGERMTHPGPYGTNDNTFIVSNEGTDPPTPTVRLSASPNPVQEGNSVTVTAHLSAALSGSSVTVPLVLTAGTAEAEDYGTLESISIEAGSVSASGQIATMQDEDLDNETFTVELGTLPSSVGVGNPRSVVVTINDVSTPPPSNRPPTVTATCAPCRIGPGDGVGITASASDPDDDPLTYGWTAARGRFAGAIHQASVRWVAPVAAGRYIVGVRVSDGHGGTASAEVAIEVTIPNAPPSFEQSSYAFDLPEGVSGPVVLGNVSADDPDGDALTYALLAGDGGRFTVAATDGTVMYVGTGEDFEAEPNRFTLTVRASDSSGGEAQVEVVVAVTNVNVAPQASDDSGRTLEDRAVVIDVLSNDSDSDGDRLRVESVSDANHGTTRVTADGGVEYTPARDYHGPDGFTYVVADTDGATATAAVTLTIIPVNDAPAAVGAIPEQRLEQGTGAEAVRLTLELSAFFQDVDGDDLTYSALTSNAGVATAGMTGSRLTISSAGEGKATIAAVARDPEGLIASQAVEVTVERVDSFRWGRGWRLKLLNDVAERSADNVTGASEPN